MLESFTPPSCELYSQFMRPRRSWCSTSAPTSETVSRSFLSLHARVVAVEPFPECAHGSGETFRRRCIVVENGWWVPPGSERLSCEEERGLTCPRCRSNGSRSTPARGRFAEDSGARRSQIDVTTLDQLIAEHGVPRFTKIDVEGFEPEVLGGPQQSDPGVEYRVRGRARRTPGSLHRAPRVARTLRVRVLLR